VTNPLDRAASEYKPGAATSFENDLILNWYPQRILRRIGKAQSLLELGVGHGYTTALFAPHFKRHVVLEGSPLVINLFKKHYPECAAHVEEVFFENFRTDEQFDLVLMGFVLEHVAEPEEILLRYRRYIQPGGKLFVAVPNAKSLNRRLGLELGIIRDIYELNDNDRALGHQRQFCRDSINDLLQRTGYRVTWEEGIYLKPLPLRHLQALPEAAENFQAMLRVGAEFPDLCVGLLLEALPA
jgi:trans-aconitate methyltransferase